LWAWRGGRLATEFAADMREGIVEFGSVDKNDPKLDEFVKQDQLLFAELRRSGSYAGLKAEWNRIDKEKGIGGKRMFYLATAPEFFAGDH
jgi:glucose-6-phosphate 1-dehydrogenase